MTHTKILDYEISLYNVQTLLSIQKQLQLAAAEMEKSGGALYIFSESEESK